MSENVAQKIGDDIKPKIPNVSSMTQQVVQITVHTRTNAHFGLKRASARKTRSGWERTVEKAARVVVSTSSIIMEHHALFVKELTQLPLL